MKTKPKVVLSWSGGKDSVLALHEIKAGGSYEITALFTTIAGDYDRVSMHGVRRVLLERQARALGYDLEIALLASDISADDYASSMREVSRRHKERGADAAAFGDIFLADARAYRERNLAEVGLRAVFPLWGRDTAGLAASFEALGYKAVVTCVDGRVLGRDFVGREYDGGFVANLPPGVDPCGENGEFHTFVYDGPAFREPISFDRGNVVFRENRFYYCDLLPV